MGLLVIPFMLLATTAPRSTPDAKLADFSRMSRALNAEVALIGSDGTVREGRLIAATPDRVTMRFGANDRSFARAEVVSAERVRDSSRDGLIKGVVFGAVTGLFAVQGLDTLAEGIAGWVGSIAVYGSIGWAIDAAQGHREPIYRAPTAVPAPKKPALSLAVRF